MEDFGWTTGIDEEIVHQARIDSGAFGEVHKMMNVTSGELFARKLIRPFGTITKDDILKESRVGDKLAKHGDCENLVHVLRHAWLSESPYYFIDMELCDFNLEEYIKSGQYNLLYDFSDNPHLLGLPFKERGVWNVWDIMEQISTGVLFIHETGQVHRDLKPRNVLYSETAKAWKVADFGLTSDGTSKKALTTKYSAGTSSYRAPEMLREHAMYNNKVDIFALGCLLFELVTGGAKAFDNDFAVHEYSLVHTKIEIPSVGIDDRWKMPLTNVIHNMLDIESSNRPSAKSLQTQFALNRLTSLGEEFKLRGDINKAIEAYQAATRLETAVDPSLWKCLGDLCVEAKRYHDSLSAYQGAATSGLSPSSLADGLGAALLNTDDYDGAIEQFKVATTRSPSDSSLWNLRGDAHLGKGDIDGAISMFKKAAKQKVVAPMTYEKLAKAYSARGDIDKAMSCIGLAVKRYPESDTLLATISEVVERRPREPNPKVVDTPKPTRPRLDTIDWVKRRSESWSKELENTSTNLSSIIRSFKPRDRKSPRPHSDVYNATHSPEASFVELSSTLSRTAESTTESTTESATLWDEEMDKTVDMYSGIDITKGSHLVALWKHPSKNVENEVRVSPGDIVVVQSIYRDGSILGYKDRQTIWTIDTLPDNTVPSSKSHTHLNDLRLKISRQKRPQPENSREHIPVRCPLNVFVHGKVWKNVSGWDGRTMQYVKKGLVKQKSRCDNSVSKNAISLETRLSVTIPDHPEESWEGSITPSTRKLEPRDAYSNREPSWWYRGQRERAVSISDPVEIPPALPPRPSAAPPPKPKTPKRKTVAGTVPIPVVIETDLNGDEGYMEELSSKF